MAKAYEARIDDTFRVERTGRRVNCNICHSSLAVGSLRSHLSTQHNVYQCFVIKDSQEGPFPPPRKLMASFFPVEGKFRFPPPPLAPRTRKATDTRRPSTCGGTLPTATHRTRW